MKQKFLPLSVLVAVLLLGMHQIFGQGVTTGGMNGKITDKAGEVLPGATITAIHVPTGSRYGNVSDLEGFFRIPNMKAGGPYKIAVSFVGYDNIENEGVYITLGQAIKYDVVLSQGSTQLEELVVSASQGQIFDGNRNGASTAISEDQLSQLPNASRGINDFVRLTPQAAFTAGGGISIAGTNNRYNSIFIDGAVSNDVFGLADNGQNGGQVSGLSLISMDALEQIQVDVSPYNVTLGGFSGGSISAVTRSGTNEFEGSAYYLVRNQGLSGKTPGFLEVVGQEREKLADYTAKTSGFRLGGPIIKDKLFFFVNGEIQRDQTPNPFNFSTYNGGVSKAEIESLATAVKAMGYDPGGFEDTKSTLNAEKFLIKLDWNINDNHKLTFRHSYNNGESLSPGRSTTSRIRFENQGISFPSKTNSTTIELNSNFDNKSNKLIIGRTNVNDNRDPMGKPFPYIDIRAGDIELGSEEFSTGNILTQNIITITDNFSIYKGKHTWTIGTHNEFYNINNVFIRQNFGSYDFASIAGFLANNPTQYDISYSLVDETSGDDTKAAAAFKAMQLGFYVQDEIQVNDKIKMTAGIRVDIPMFSEDPVDDGYFNTTAAPKIKAAGYDLKGAQAGKAPGAQLLIAPRFGINYDVNGDQTIQIRGGIGIFTSRVPFVWPGGMYNNNGATVGGTRQTNLPNGFISDPFNQPTLADFGGTDAKPQGQMDLFADNFKFPQVLRASFGIDQKLPIWGLIGSMELIITKTLNNVFYENVNLAPPTQRFGGTPDNRYRFTNGRIESKYTAVYLGSNTNEGSTKNVTLSLTKPFDNGLTANVAYNYGVASSIFEGTSSQNSSQWRGVYAINGRNNAPVGTSDFSAGSRILSSISYRKEYAGFMASSFSLFYNGQSGSPYSVTYNSGSWTGEDSRERALIYVPANRNEIVFSEKNRSAAEQWADLDAYISNDPYLKNRRGQYAKRNGSRTPFTNIIDLKFVQEFFLENINGNRHSLQLSFDIFNFTNLLNKDWGRRYDSNFGGLYLLNTEGSIKGPNGETIPTWSFRSGIKDATDILTKDDSGLISSRWQMQFGLRYSF